MRLLVDIKKLLLSQRRLIVYCMIGCSGVVIDYAIFAVLTKIMGVHYQIANALGVSLGICNNFVWNAYLNFKVYDRLLRRFFSFYCVGLVGLLISAGLLCLLVETLKRNVLISKLVIIIVVTVVQFLLNKFVTFRKG